MEVQERALSSAALSWRRRLIDGLAVHGGAALLVLLLVAVVLASPGARAIAAWLESWFVIFGLAAALAVAVLMDARPPRAPTRRWTGVVRSALAIAGAACAFMLPVIATWMQRESWFGAAGGILPHSDAAQYYAGACQVLAGGALDDWGCRRPLNDLLLAVRLALCGEHLSWAILLQGALLGYAALALARVVAADLGAAAAVAVFAMSYAIGREHVATCLSEALGLTFGLLATAALWSAARERRPLAIAAGAGVLTLGLSARAGAYFVLPMLVLWSLVAVGGPARARLRAAALVGAAAVGCVALNAALVLGYGHHVGVGNGNFSWVLYALSTGHPGWQRAMSDFPQLTSMSDHEISAFLYAHAWANIRAHPLDLIAGLGRGLGASWTEAWRYVQGLAGFGSPLAGDVFLLLVAAGLALAAWRRPRHPALGLWLANLVGMALSAPFILPDGGSRVMVCSWPMLAMAVPVALWAFATEIDRLRLRRTGEPPVPTEVVIQAPAWRRPALIAVVLAVVAAVGPSVAHLLAPERLTTAAPDEVVARIGPGTPAIELIPQDVDEQPFVPRVRREDLAEFREQLSLPERRGMIIEAFVLDRERPRCVWLVSREPIDLSRWRTVRCLGSADGDYVHVSEVRDLP